MSRLSGASVILAGLLLVCAGSAANGAEAVQPWGAPDFSAFSAGDLSSGELKLGAMEVHPALSVSETYDDNLLRASDDPSSDWITRITPSLGLALPLQRFQLQLRGQVDIVTYVDHTGENATNWSLGATLGAVFPGGLNFQVSDTYTSQYLTSSQEFGEGENTGRNIVEARAGYRVRDDWRIEVGWYNTLFQFDSSLQRERDENDVELLLFRRFTPRTSALAELGYSRFDYDSNTAQDNTAVRAALGLTWDVTARSQGLLKGGYEWKSYQNEDPALGTENADYFVVAARLRHLVTPRMTAELEASHGSKESDFVGNPYYLQTSVGVGIAQRFTPKVTIRVGASYVHDAYPNQVSYLLETGTRSDTVLLLSAGVGFEVYRWLHLELGYRSERRTSDFADFEYTDNQASATVGARF